MKKILLILVLLSTINFIKAQDCNVFFPTEKGTKFEITNYDKKNKEIAKVKHEIKESNSNGNGVDLKVQAKTWDVKGKELVTTDYLAKCNGGKFYLDMTTFIPSDKMASMEGMEMEMAESFLEFPEQIKVGDKLPDGKVNVKFKSSGVNIMSIAINITNREVMAEEEVTTSAGTYKCFKIKQISTTKIGMMTVTSTTYTWFAMGVGMVKQEVYDKKQKFMGKSELTAFSK